MKRVALLTPLQLYLVGGLLAVVARFVEPFSEIAFVVLVFIALLICVAAIVKYFRS